MRLLFYLGLDTYFCWVKNSSLCFEFQQNNFMPRRSREEEKERKMKRRIICFCLKVNFYFTSAGKNKSCIFKYIQHVRIRHCQGIAGELARKPVSRLSSSAIFGLQNQLVFNVTSAYNLSSTTIQTM